MSYSRWSNSVWYTFHNASSGDTLEDQHFTVADERTFTYKELKNLGIKHGISLIEGKYTDKEYDELTEYMQEFMRDCELQFKPKEEKKEVVSTGEHIDISKLFPKWLIEYNCDSFALSLNRPMVIEYLGDPEGFKQASKKWSKECDKFIKKWKDFEVDKEKDKK